VPTAPVVLVCPSRLETDTPLSRTVGPHPVGRSSSSLDLRCPLLGLSRRRVALEVFPASDPPWVCNLNTERVLHELDATFSAPAHHLDQSPGPPLLGFTRVRALPPVNPPSVHSRSVFPPSFGVPAPPAAHHVPSSWILTTSTVCSARRVRACCSPIRTGFAAFPDTSTPGGRFGIQRLRSGLPERLRRSPQRGSYPSKHPTRRQPYRITAALAFLPLSSPTRSPHRSACRRVARDAEPRTFPLPPKRQLKHASSNHGSVGLRDQTGAWDATSILRCRSPLQPAVAGQAPCRSTNKSRWVHSTTKVVSPAAEPHRKVAPAPLLRPLPRAGCPVGIRGAAPRPRASKHTGSGLDQAYAPVARYARLHCIGASRPAHPKVHLPRAAPPSTLSGFQLGRSLRPVRRVPIDSKAFLHRRVRSVSPRFQRPTPYTSMGFVPLRGSASPSAAPRLPREHGSQSLPDFARCRST